MDLRGSREAVDMDSPCAVAAGRIKTHERASHFSGRRHLGTVSCISHCGPSEKEFVRSVTTQKVPSPWDRPEPPDRPYENTTSATADYYARAESILRSYSAEPHQVLQSDKAPTEEAPSVPQSLDPQVSRYVRPGKDRYSEIPIPVHLKVLYAELYEACWTGDNELIQELCLPKHLSEDKEPIHIFVQTTVNDFGGPLMGYSGMP
jgi:hypothetical protein